MNFNSVEYIIFLPIAVLLYFAVPKKIKNLYLLALSYYFYWCSEVRFFLILPVLTLMTYLCALALDKSQGKKRKAIFLFTLIANFAVLIFFKYNRFFLSQISTLSGLQFNKSKWFLPMGLSFYLFTSVGYIIDVYLNKQKAERNLVKYGVFIAFFPHVLMGPIDRAGSFLPQLEQEHTFDYSRTVKALQLMAIGFFKKIAVADILAMFISQVHSDLTSYTGLMLIFTAFAFSIQLYADFSGYSDIARASAMLLDFKIMENFNVPYLSTSFSQFWSRWHISLSSWFQDYIFTPFVWVNPLKKLPIIGKYFENPPVLPAIALVFISSGVWHGDTWNFVIWGAFHAVYRIGEDLMRKYYKKPDKHPKPLKYWGKVAWVFSLVTFSQIFFRSKTIQGAVYYITHLFVDLSINTFSQGLYNSIKGGFDATPILIYAYIAYCIIVVAVLIYMDFYRNFRLKGKCLTTAFITMKPYKRWLCYYGLVALIMAGFIMNNGGYGASASFIYNNF
ncbi:MAG: MBOAT family O-acyltransferase [Oscillospiraceae bacterium]